MPIENDRLSSSAIVGVRRSRILKAAMVQAVTDTDLVRKGFRIKVAERRITIHAVSKLALICNTEPDQPAHVVNKVITQSNISHKAGRIKTLLAFRSVPGTRNFPFFYTHSRC